MALDFPTFEQARDFVGFLLAGAIVTFGAVGLVTTLFPIKKEPDNG